MRAAFFWVHYQYSLHNNPEERSSQDKHSSIWFIIFLKKFTIYEIHYKIRKVQISHRPHLRECYSQIYHVNIHVCNAEATVNGPHFSKQSSDWLINFPTQYNTYLISKNTRQLGVCGHQSTSYQKFFPPESATSKIPAIEVHWHMVNDEWQMGRNSK